MIIRFVYWYHEYGVLQHQLHQYQLHQHQLHQQQLHQQQLHQHQLHGHQHLIANHQRLMIRNGSHKDLYLPEV